MILFLLLSCGGEKAPAPTAEAPKALSSCQAATNTCDDYSPYWLDACPNGARCITFKNSCKASVALAYQVGCDGDGKPGAPQCNCSTTGPAIPTGGSVYWKIVDGDYANCLPSWTPACLTAGLAVIANLNTATCASGTRVEFTAGNTADAYGKFDSYNLSVGPPAGQFYSIPVSFEPNITCAHDTANYDCRPLWCDSSTCPDAYSTPTTGGCSDGRSPQAGCQDTFGNFGTPVGFTVEYCPASGKSCQDAKACPS